MDKLTLSQLEQYLSKAAWILKGPIGASDFKAYIFPMLFFKRISDVYDEEYQTALEESGGDEDYAALPEFHRFVIPEGCHWNDVRETTFNVGLKIERCLREIESANQDHLHGIFGDPAELMPPDTGGGLGGVSGAGRGAALGFIRLLRIFRLLH
jgi:type I restriction enzyme M protein